MVEEDGMGMVTVCFRRSGTSDIQDSSVSGCVDVCKGVGRDLISDPLPLRQPVWNIGGKDIMPSSLHTCGVRDIAYFTPRDIHTRRHASREV